ncbi:MAG: helix-turn-helix domain-containing protein, partial [Arenicellales bacterium]|nr:helix-turn-helix domain-containing protein [Arenicellales bacterium]
NWIGVLSEMQHLYISIRLPEGHWAGDISRGNHNITFQIVEHMALSKGRGSVRVLARGRGIQKLKEDLLSHRGIESALIHDEGSDSIAVNLTISKGGGGFLRPLIESEVLPNTPFEIRDGWVDWIFDTDNSHMKNLIKKMRESGLQHKIHSVSKNGGTRLLTIRQREIFDLAIEEGYYETPRRITLTNLATKAGISKSTICEITHIIERKIIEEFSESIRGKSPKAKKNPKRK